MRAQPVDWPVRGSVYEVALPHGGQLVIVVSSDARNQYWSTAVVARIVPHGGLGDLEPVMLEARTAVPLTDLEPVKGVVLLDFLYTLEQTDITASPPLGRITAEAMQAVNIALISALDLPPYQFIEE